MNQGARAWVPTMEPGLTKVCSHKIAKNVNFDKIIDAIADNFNKNNMRKMNLCKSVKKSVNFHRK